MSICFPDPYRILILFRLQGERRVGRALDLHIERELPAGNLADVLLLLVSSFAFLFKPFGKCFCKVCECFNYALMMHA